MLRPGWKGIVCLLGMLCAGGAFGQLPIPLEEQVEFFNSLPPAQQRALVRELQDQLPPAQQQAIIDALQGRSAPGQQAGLANIDPSQLDMLDRLLQEQQVAAQDETAERPARFEGGDTLVIRFNRRESLEPARADAADEAEIEAFQERLEEGNPYELDAAGRLYLPGIPAMALAGLNVEQATIRLEAETSLRQFEVEITRLPLKPVGIEALEPFGYDLFEQQGSALRLLRPATSVPVPVDYVIGPGDTLNVQLFGSRNVEYFLTVSREGFINFPEIGPINVSGLSFENARNLIGERVREQILNVRVSTTLGELRSIEVFVAGDVERPGSYTVSGFATMTDALFESGGVEPIGSLRNIVLRRGGEIVSTLDLYDLLLRGDASGDVRLQPGDVVFVPPIGPTVSVDGEVKRPAVYEIEDGTSVRDVIELAGGLNASASRAIRIERIAPNGGIDVQGADLSSPTGGQIAVQDGDVLRITPSPSLLESSVRLEGNVFEPGLHEWTRGMRLADLIPGPQWLKPLSDLNYVLIRRELEPNIRIDVLSADLEAAWANPNGGENLELDPRDTVYVFNLDIGRQHIVKPILEELDAQQPPNAPERTVRVSGQVRAPGDYPLEPGMRVSDLLRAGGGMTPAAYGAEAELARYSVVNGEYRRTELIRVDLAALVRGDEEADIAIAPYDFLSIREVPRWGESETVVLRGEVMFPGTYPIREGETLSSVIERAGGLTELAFAEGSIFTRVEARETERRQVETLARRIETELATISLSDPENSEVISIGQTLINRLRNTEPVGRVTIQLQEVLAGTSRTPDIELRDGDTLFVPRFRPEVTVLGEVQYPTSHLYASNLDRDDYLSRSGGLTARADKKRIYVVRASGEVVVDSGGGWFRRRSQDEIRPGDTIVVPPDVDRVRPLAQWSSVTQVIYNLAIAAAAVSSF